MKTRGFVLRLKMTRERTSGRRGIALILVMTIVALVSVLVVGMLISARKELVTAHNYSSGNSVQMLGDTVRNLVIAQIKKATSDSSKAWISQPGLIRTFSPSGQQNAFKLYSSYVMEEGSNYDPGASSTLNAEVPLDWYDRPVEFVDLNRPIEFSTGLVYPVADPSQVGVVEGFRINTSGRVAPGSSLQANDLPMPVRWIYLGENGQLMTASDPNRHDAVARFAYWTDDDTSKVNINTAAGGVFFDTPAANTKEDHMLGRTQPIAQEYQRWPGHPSTTSLRPVLKVLRDIADPVFRSEITSQLTPRIGWGGSLGGTEYAWLTRNLGQTDSDRLFPSLDEFYYGLDFRGSGSSQEREPFKIDGIQTVEAGGQTVPQLSFFLTAHSRAPELNLFHRPRVSLWPFNHELVQGTPPPNTLTPEDKLIRLATEYGGWKEDGNHDYTKRKRFYFQRKSAWDPFVDYNEIPENKALLGYLRDMTSRPIPSADPSNRGGTSFATKLGNANRNQLLISMWDYIRSQVNPVNQAYVPVGFTPYSFPQGHDTEDAGHSDVAPLIVDDSASGIEGKGLGRTAVPVEVILQFYNAGEGYEMATSPAPGDPEFIDERNNVDFSSGPDGIPDYVVRRVRMVVLLAFQMPVNHLYDSAPRFQIEITGNPFSMITQSPGSQTPPEVIDGDTLNEFEDQVDELDAQVPILVRSTYNTVSGGGTWATQASLGFPGTSATNRTICYVSAYGFAGLPRRGGPASIALPMYAPLDNEVMQDNRLQYYQKAALKVLSNRTTVTGRDSAYQLSKGWSGRQDVFYPFVSDILEFRLPHRHDVQPDADGDGKLDPGWENPANGKLPGAWNGLNPNYDYLLTFLKGSELELTIYPGLKEDANELSPVAANWQTPTSDNYLFKTQIKIENTVIPLPRLGDGEVATLRPSQWTSALRQSGSPPTVRELSDYYKRLNNQSLDFVMNVPTRLEGGDAPLMTDVFRSYALTGGNPVHGDVRSLAIERDVPRSWWQRHPRYLQGGVFLGTGYVPEHSKNNSLGLDPRENTSFGPVGKDSIKGGSSAFGAWGRLHADVNQYYQFTQRTVSPFADASIRTGSPKVGDFSLGYGNARYGALVVGPDLGSTYLSANARSEDTESPYFMNSVSRAGSDDDVSETAGNNFKNFMGLLYSPFRQMPSPVLFGTLPMRKAAGWETPLFNPNPAGGRNTHRGWNQTPRDHHLLDLFWMPVVEPYAISENLSTAGKVNLNYQIAPFTYIERRTGLHAVLDTFTSHWKTADAEGAILAVPEDEANKSSVRRGSSHSMKNASTDGFRHFIDVDATLDAFDQRFQANDPFVSASEICEMFLLPEGVADAGAFWSDKTLTGDDKLEAPYNAIYPRVTTQSNTFTIHYWVERLAPTKSNSDAPRVLGRYRGSTTIERYLNAREVDYGATVPDSADINADLVYPPLNDRYLFRVVEQKHFAL